MKSKIIVKILNDINCVFQRNLLESRHLLICLPEIAAGKLRDLLAGQQRNLGAGLGVGQPRDLGTGQPRDLEADKHSLMI